MMPLTRSDGDQVLGSEKRLLRENHVKHLLEAGTNKSPFDIAHGALDKDKSVDKELADAIAHDYINTARDINARKSWKTRKAAIDAIRNKFEERAYQQSKIQIVEKHKLT